jgi:hypothetical protein
MRFENCNNECFLIIAIQVCLLQLLILKASGQSESEANSGIALASTFGGPTLFSRDASTHELYSPEEAFNEVVQLSLPGRYTLGVASRVSLANRGRVAEAQASFEVTMTFNPPIAEWDVGKQLFYNMYGGAGAHTASDFVTEQAVDFSRSLSRSFGSEAAFFSTFTGQESSSQPSHGVGKMRWNP